MIKCITIIYTKYVSFIDLWINDDNQVIQS